MNLVNLIRRHIDLTDDVIDNTIQLLILCKEIETNKKYDVEYCMNSFSTSIIRAMEGSFRKGDKKFINATAYASEYEIILNETKSCISKMDDKYQNILYAYYFYGFSTYQIKQGVTMSNGYYKESTPSRSLKVAINELSKFLHF